MPAPQNYMLNIPDPTQSVMSGLQTGINLSNAIDQQKARETEAIRQQKLQEAIGSLDTNPSVENYVSVANMLPKDQADSVRASWELLDKTQQQERLGFGGRVMAAIDADPQIAINLLNENADAARNSGNEDEAKVYDTWAQLVEANPNAAKHSIGVMLASAPGGDKVLGSVKTLAETDKLRMEIRKTEMELDKLEETGGIDPEKKFEQEKKLRDEYVKRTAGFTESQRVYDNMKESASSGAAGDIALVTSFMKMLDPGSVVRETEFATARDTAGLLTRLQSLAKKVETGEFLTTDQRKSFVSLAGKYMAAAEKQEKGIRDDLGRVVKNYKLTKENVFGGKGEKTKEVTPIPTTIALPDGRSISFPDQASADKFKQEAGL